MTSNEKKLQISMGAKPRTLHIDYLTRVEGEGSLLVHAIGDEVKKIELSLFEPPRFFEALLQNRLFTEAPDITARICGICPVAYQMSAVYAMEQGLHLEVPEPIHQLRRMMYCGEWIESHSLHIYLLHLPDFLNCEDAVSLAKKNRSIVEHGLLIKKTGNALIKALGGRAIHPINVKVGGFYKLPSLDELSSLKPLIHEAIELATKDFFWISTLSFPHAYKQYECVSLFHPSEYPMARGTIISTSGLKIDPCLFSQYFEEKQVPYSNALHCTMKSKGSYLVGPIARYNLAHDLLSPYTKKLLKEIDFESECTNPYRSILIRFIEVIYALEESLRIIDSYQGPIHSPSVEISPYKTTGYGVTEAPRGLLYHRYQINDEGFIELANIIPPTSQNQKMIEEDLFELVQKNLSLDDPSLRHLCEKTIRNFDPCISCSTHFLNLKRNHPSA